MKALYFAWVRERIGLAEEEIHPPASVETVGQLIEWLAAIDERHAHAFDGARAIRAALDKSHVGREAKIGAAREVAFFPPMTGG